VKSCTGEDALQGVVVYSYWEAYWGLKVQESKGGDSKEVFIVDTS